MKYDKVKSVQYKLGKAELISLTMDMWTGFHNHGYISLSAHCINDWEMHHHCLQTCEVVLSHKPENLAEEIHHSLDEWNITKSGYGDNR